LERKIKFKRSISAHLFEFPRLTKDLQEKMMKAIQISEYGNNDVVKVVDVEIPVPQADEVVVKIKNAGVNPVDWKIRSGAGERLGLKLPIMLGGEITGTIEKVGDEVTDFKAGDAVYGMVKTGGFAEFSAAKASDIALKPESLSFEHAAATALGGLTAWQAIFDNANLKEGQKILITGASGAVGSLAVQFAKAKGAYVIGSASGGNEIFVREIGADEFINYKTQNFEELVKEMDVVFDTVGGDTFERAHRTLKKGGFLVTSVAFPNEEKARKFGIKTARVFCQPNAEELAQISELVETGKVKARVATVLPFAEIKKAFELSESGQANGKIVLQMET
jgi:NADPH:quinone reductase-like Zn-dependent oxidoreductase